MEGKIQTKNYTAIYFCSLLTTSCVFPPRHYHYSAVYPYSLCTVAFVLPLRHNHYIGVYFSSLITLPCVFPHRHYRAYRILNSVQILLLPLICAMWNTVLTKKICSKCISQWTCKIQEKLPDSEFPGNVSRNWQSVLCYTPLIHRHLISGYTERWGKWSVYPDNRALTSVSQIALDGAVGPLGNHPGLTMISSSRQVYTGISWTLLSVSQPKPQDSKTFRIDIIHWYVSVTVGNKAYVPHIHNSIFSTLEVDTACYPPKMSLQVCPDATLKSIYNEVKVLQTKLHSLRSHFNPMCTCINSH
jgi:hypothetical protein